VFTLAIIGAGQLGSRHLQALARLSLPCQIDVVDPSPQSLEIARQRFDEMPPNAAIREVRYHSTIDALPRSLDYVIVATTANVRLRVIEALLNHASITSILLEKVLFQRADEYALALQLLESHRVRAWVNCVNRVFPIYAEISKFFATESLRYFQVRGGDWGLGCNSIHYLDILGMLTNALPELISTLDLDRTLVSSKRKNYQEFTGVLRGKYAGGIEFEIASFAASSARLQLIFRSENRTCVFDERSGAAAFFKSEDDCGWECKKFKMPYLSETGTMVATQILSEGTCALPTFEQSTAYHLPLIRALGTHAAACNGTSSDICPIT